MTSKLIQANGIQIAYDEFGDVNRPCILLIMGLGTQMIAWPEDFCRSLAAAGYRVVRFDNRDVGLSEKIEGATQPGVLSLVLTSLFGLPLRAPYTLTDMVADAVGLLDALEIDRAHVVGASMGGMIAQLLAANAADRCATLTSIMSSSGRRFLPRAKPALTRHMLSRPRDDAYEGRIAHSVRTYELISGRGFPADPDYLQAKVVAAYERCNYGDGYMRHLAAITASGSRVAALQRIAAPTLVLHGRDDPLVPVAHGIDTARWIEGARLEIIDGWGHDLPPTLLPRLSSLIVEHIESAPG